MAWRKQKKPKPAETAADGSPPATDRSPVEQVLVVGPDTALAVAVELALEQAELPARLARADGYLMAMARIGTQGPPRVLIGRVDDDTDHMIAAARGLRRLAPDLKLGLVQRNGTLDADPTKATKIRAAFDHIFAEPIDSNDMGNWIRDVFSEPATQPIKKPEQEPQVLATPEAFSSPTQPADIHAPASSDHPDPSSGSTASPDPPTASAPVDFQQSTSQQSKPQPPTQAPTHDTTTIHADASLGDVDLIEELLATQGSIQSRALQMLAGRSGIQGLGFAASGIGPNGHTHCPVEMAGVTFGHLHAPPTTTAEVLAPWAGWLARWLALDRRMDQLWHMALRDELTGAWNRRYFDRSMRMILNQAQQERSRVTLLVFDIDDFKTYNDRYGHQAGDEILAETVRLITSVVRDQDIVARIGGDEFAVIFRDDGESRRPGSKHPRDVRFIIERFKQAVSQHRYPRLVHEAVGTLTISGGLATFPWDGRSSAEMLAVADAMTKQSKRHGKSQITFGPGAQEEDRANGGSADPIAPPTSPDDWA